MRPLTTAAFEILVGDLEGHGNVLSEMHRAALLELVDTFTDYVEGATSGRKAFALPTGMGKTSSIAAFVAALHKLNNPASVAIAASKVEALCSLQCEFIHLGVPESKIGLKHSLLRASEPSTGNTSFPYQLVTHARVRGGTDFKLFGCHSGVPRALMIYDETLFRSDVLAVDAVAVRSALGALAPLVEEGVPLTTLALAQGYLAECSTTIQKTLAELREQQDTRGLGGEVRLPVRDPTEIEGYIVAVRAARIPPAYAETLEDLLRVSQEPLWAVVTSQAGGVVRCAEAVPKELGNVVILDASQPIRMLAEMDRSVEPVRSFPVDWLKTFEAVKVVQIVAGGGRHTIQRSAVALRREKSFLSQEVIELVRENWDTANGILIFTYKKRTLDIVEQLRRDIALAGFDTDAKRPDGKPRIQFLTWGDETSLNGYEYCDVVIMAGVLQQSFLGLAAAIKGQRGDRAAPTPYNLLRDTVESEVAHVIYQGASRGSCRRIDNGKARPMTLYFVHRNLGIRRWLDQVMPGADWELRQPKHLKAANAAGVVVQLAAQLLGYLRGLPDAVRKVSSKEIKASLGVADDDATKKAFTRAVQEVTEFDNCGWALEGRSLVRRDFVYYFGGNPS